MSEFGQAVLVDDYETHRDMVRALLAFNMRMSVGDQYPDWRVAPAVFEPGTGPQAQLNAPYWYGVK